MNRQRRSRDDIRAMLTMEFESLLVELGARIRDVRQGPDGYVYIAV